MAQVRVSKRADKDLKPLSPVDKRRIREAIAKLTDWPRVQADIKALQGREGFRMRVGSYRILFREIGDGVLMVDRIRPRGEAYNP